MARKKATLAYDSHLAHKTAQEDEYRRKIGQAKRRKKNDDYKARKRKRKRMRH